MPWHAAQLDWYSSLPTSLSSVDAGLANPITVAPITNHLSTTTFAFSTRDEVEHIVAPPLERI
jgi:hypothetical protein